MEEVIYQATSANIAATILRLHRLGWRIIDKLVVGRHEVQLTKGHVEVMYDYHVIVERPALACANQEAATCP